MQLLESKIQEAKSKKDTLKARAQSARYVQWVCFICSFVLWLKGALQEVSYRLWYLMLFCILWHLKLWIPRLQTILLSPLFLNSEVLLITEGWMWFDFHRLLCVRMINKHWQSKTKKLWGRTQVARLMWYVWHDHTYNRGHTKFSSAFELDWEPQKELLEIES